MKRLLNRIGRLDAHHRLALSLLVAAIAGGAVFNDFFWSTRVVLTWISYAGSMLFLSWTTLFQTTPGQLRHHSNLQDTGRSLIFILVVVSILISLLAIVSLLLTTKQQSPLLASQHIILSVLAVICSWLLIHTVFALHYAHLYYSPGNKERQTPIKGLLFPQQDEPDYLDFAYFSFVIGMATQVSDVQVQSRVMRRQVLLHSLFSFAFNTLILALAINVLSGLL